MLKKILSVVAASAAVVTMNSAVAHAAPADTVLFGDSFFANPSYNQVDPRRVQLSSNVDIGQGSGAPSPQGCPQGERTVGRELQRISGQRVINYACSAAAASADSPRQDFDDQVGHAIRTGALHPGTKNVLLQFGFNDVAQTTLLADPNRTAYRNAARAQVNRIKHAAPDAKITFVSYPAISAPNGAVCPIRTDGSSRQGFNVDLGGVVRGVENNINHTMYQASRDTGTHFYDLRKATLAHNMCASDSQRWISGAMEYSVPHNLYNHLTHSGITGVANLLNANVIRY